MASQGRILPPHLCRPLPGPGAVHPDPYSSAIHPPPAGFPPFEMLPPREVMEQKLSAQHVEIEKLATENRRLAATHGSLRQDLATAKHDLQLVHSHIADMKTGKEHQTRGIMEKISMMEAELESSKHMKLELQQSRVEAQNLVAVRKELVAKVQQVTRDLQMPHSEAQQIPGLMSEHDSLRQEYQHYRATFDYEKKLYHDHLESLQVMEKNYAAMTREVEKLRAELNNSANYDPRTGGPHSGSTGYNVSVPVANYNPTQNAYGAAHDTRSFKFCGKPKMSKKKKKGRLQCKESSHDDLLEKKGNVADDEVDQMSSGDEDYSKGMKKWVMQYHQSRPGIKVLQQRIDDFITANEALNEQARKEREAQAAECGWTVVVHHKGGKKTTDAASGTAVGSVAQAAVLDKMAKKKSKEAGLDFYRFQRREAHRNEIMMLRSKFEQDKKRIQEMRAARKFRPY